MNSKMASMALAVITLLGLAAGCGDACDDAADKLDECGVSTSARTQPGEGEAANAPKCSGATECGAECTVEASCSDILDFYAGNLDNAYAQCISKCGR